MQRLLRWAAVGGVIAGAAFSYGVWVAHSHVFPYAPLKAVQERIELGWSGTASIEAGARLFGRRCSACHGTDGSGGRGPNLRVRMQSILANRGHLEGVLEHGIPGTAMRGQDLSDVDLRRLEAFLKTLTDTSHAAAVAGDPERGRAVVHGAGKCLTCHQLAGAGGRLGPELTGVAARRGPDYLARSITDPAHDIAPGYQTVHVLAEDGTALTGRLLDETAYSVRVLGTDERLHSFAKAQLTSLSVDSASLMPSYRDVLDSGAVADVVAYLVSLTDPASSAAADPPAAPPAALDVTYDRILAGARTGTDWLTYSGGYDGRRFSPLTRIRPSTVPHLTLRWVRQIRTLGRLEATPLEADGVLYMTSPGGGVSALDVLTGHPFWEFKRTPDGRPALCCGDENRGVALLGGRVYVGTVDAHLLALDAATGAVIWDRVVANADSGYSITGAPLAVKDMIITGVAGGEFGIRGFLDAYDARTGKRRWRFYTVPGPGAAGHETWSGDSWKRGGAPTWLTGSFDPDLNLVYWGVGNPGPNYNGTVRRGDNLYSDAVVALDADSGTLEWYFQFTPHDQHDWDAVQVPVQATVSVRGRPRKVLVWANRNAFYYVLDRATGQFLLARQFADQTWAQGIDSTGRPIERQGATPSAAGVRVAPSVTGGTNWWSPTFDPMTGLLYVSAIDGEAIFHQGEVSAGEGFYAGSSSAEEVLKRGGVRAIDAATGRVRWEYPFSLVAPSPAVTSRYETLSHSGLLSTASGLVFGGTNSGSFFALDARTGRELWRQQLGGPIVMGPITYSYGGEQLITVAAGQAVFTFGLK